MRSSRDKNWFGRRLKAAREAARISQEELAERVDLTRLTIARYETGRLRPNFERLEPLAIALSQPLWWFFTEQDELPRGATTLEEFRDEVLARLSALEDRLPDRTTEPWRLSSREHAVGYEADPAEAEQGDKRAAEILRRSILEILSDRFGQLSPSVGLHLKEIDNLTRLQDLLKKSATARNLSQFLQEVTRGV